MVNFSLLGSIFVSQGQYWSIRVDIVQIDNGQSVKSQSINTQSVSQSTVSQSIVSQSILSQSIDQHWSVIVNIRRENVVFNQQFDSQSVNSQSINSQSVNSQSVNCRSVNIVNQLVSHCQYQERDGWWLINNLIAILYKIISFGYIGGPKKGHLVHYTSSH